MIPESVHVSNVEDWAYRIICTGLDRINTIQLLRYYHQNPEDIPNGYKNPEFLSHNLSDIELKVNQVFQGGKS